MTDPITLQTLRDKKVALQERVRALLNEFQREFGTHIESIDFRHEMRASIDPPNILFLNINIKI